VFGRAVEDTEEAGDSESEEDKLVEEITSGPDSDVVRGAEFSWGPGSPLSLVPSRGVAEDVRE